MKTISKPLKSDVIHLLTIAEICDLTRMGRTAIYREIAIGHLRTIKRGRSVRVRSDEYQRWVEELDAATSSSK